MNELELKYGCNPNQKPARVFMKNGAALPFTVLNGKPGYINLLDAFSSWQLVRELKEATGLPAAASFKHVSPAGAALGLPLDEVDKRVYFVAPGAALSPIACAYIRARGADRLCSYGDWAALSDECDAATAAYLKNEVSDGIIAPAYSDEALAILKTKKGGKYNIVQIDPAYTPAPLEQKDVFGITFEQGHNDCKIDESLLTNIVTENKDLPEGAKRDMLLALITLKYTQSNSVCYVKDGQAIGVGAGQQSRIHCTRLAGQKADNWYLRRHPKVLALSFVDDIRRIRARGADRLCSYGDWAALSDECDAATAAYLKNEVSDGIIAPAYSDEALAILKTKKGGKYNIVQIDPAYTPAPLEQKDVFGITFEQGHNDCKIDESLLTNIVTENKDLPEGAKRDMLLALITLKYTQSNSVCYVKDGQAIGVGAGQQSRIHCTRLAGQKADNWYLRRHPKVLALSFVDDIRRPDRDNAIDVYLSDECDDVLADGAWQRVFQERPEALTGEEKRAWLAQQRGVTVGSDAFFPFGDNVERARKSGASYIVEPGGSIRDDNVIETANRYGITMAFTGMRLFHH